MFEAERVYNQRNPSTGIIEWFFLAREGYFGPYVSKEAAHKQLNTFISFCVKNGDDGGRGKKSVKSRTTAQSKSKSGYVPVPTAFVATKPMDLEQVVDYRPIDYTPDFSFQSSLSLDPILRLEPAPELSNKRREYRD